MAAEVNSNQMNSHEGTSTFPKTIVDEAGEEIIIKYEKKPERGEWGNRFEFILCCIGTAVGLGNVWRFPYLCFKNGGGAFLIPYAITLCFIGLPLFFMELAIGQFASIGAIGIWNISPMFKGVGYGMVIISAIISVYYNIIIGHCIYYFGVSFATSLPWANCNNSWNNRTRCYDGSNNSTLISNRTSPSEEYYDNYVLNKSQGIEDIGLPQWKILICFFIAWLLVIIILLKGIKYMGKVSYITALFPYIILTILLIRGLLLPGSLTGILYYLKPNFSYLSKPIVWVEAATQIFFSLSLCNGNLITMSSYNHFKNNCLRDAVLVAVINCATSVYGGFVIFSNMGFMAHMKNVSMSEVVKGGPGLAFIVYPEALTEMPIAPLWSVLFFLMMIILGIGSQISLVETVLASIQDELQKRKILTTESRKIVCRICICLLLVCIGIPMTCRGGIYLLELFDKAVSGCPMLVLALIELLVVSYCYGIDRFRVDVKLMIGKKPNNFWKYSWMAISPFLIFVLIIALAIFAVIEEKPAFSSGFMALMNIISTIPVMLVIFVFIFVYCRNGGWTLFSELRKPLQIWGPAQDDNRQDFHQSIQCIKGDTVSKTNFFQSKESIANKFNRRANLGGSENQVSSSNQNIELEALVESPLPK